MRTFLLLGLTGVGKSSFVNATFGVELAETHEFVACTKVVRRHARSTAFGEVCLIDTPGLSESSAAVDLKYLRLVRDEVASFDGITTLYISPLSEVRMRPTEKSALQLITSELGSKVWRHAWLILTFAANVRKDKVQATADARHRQVDDHIRSLSRSRPHFTGFRKVVMIDNIVSDWAKGAVGIDRVLSTSY